tara:strand:+ start:464 stop:703 length:240 start_codon:yes stop_codon:yes gene_type:complete
MEKMCGGQNQDPTKVVGSLLCFTLKTGGLMKLPLLMQMSDQEFMNMEVGHGLLLIPSSITLNSEINVSDEFLRKGRLRS